MLCFLTEMPSRPCAERYRTDIPRRLCRKRQSENRVPSLHSEHARSHGLGCRIPDSGGTPPPRSVARRRHHGAPHGRAPGRSRDQHPIGRAPVSLPDTQRCARGSALCDVCDRRSTVCRGICGRRAGWSHQGRYDLRVRPTEEAEAPLRSRRRVAAEHSASYAGSPVEFRSNGDSARKAVFQSACGVHAASVVHHAGGPRGRMWPTSLSSDPIAASTRPCSSSKGCSADTD